MHNLIATLSKPNVVEVTMTNENGRWHYRAKVFDKQGNLVIVKMDGLNMADLVLKARKEINRYD